MTVTCKDCCKIVSAWLLPPFAVFLERGCGAQLCINILLCLLGWIPGVIHACFIVVHCDRDDDDKYRKHGGKTPEQTTNQPADPMTQTQQPANLATEQVPTQVVIIETTPITAPENGPNKVIAVESTFTDQT